MPNIAHGNNMRNLDHAKENWLRMKVSPAYDAIKTAPWRAITAEEIRAWIAAEHKKFIAGDQQR